MCVCVCVCVCVCACVWVHVSSTGQEVESFLQSEFPGCHFTNEAKLGNVSHGIEGGSRGHQKLKPASCVCVCARVLVCVCVCANQASI